jgi:2-polyprenyl-3-methyl-5-hydroxy-6-metoxy-1,4-benzoquinol methylase
MNKPNFTEISIYVDPNKPVDLQNKAFVEKLLHMFDGDEFVQKVVDFFARGIGGKIFQNYVRYALLSLNRGEKLVHTYAEDISNLRSYLDVGCAYGGAPIAMAKQGVERCVGIEYDGRLLTLAETLARRESVMDRIHFECRDITSYADVEHLGTFNLITCIDVLEHVLNPKAAIVNLARLTNADGGTLVVDVPNPNSHVLVTEDPHHHLFGSILLPREDAIRAFEDEFPGNKRYTVGYFHELDWYIEHLRSAGCSVDVTDKFDTSETAARETRNRQLGLKAKFEAISTAWPLWRRDLISEALDNFLRQAERNSGLITTDPQQFQLQYALPVYHLRCQHA